MVGLPDHLRNWFGAAASEGVCQPSLLWGHLRSIIDAGPGKSCTMTIMKRTSNTLLVTAFLQSAMEGYQGLLSHHA
jgi:hypothetical protein